MDRLDFPIELKLARGRSDGTFEGYGSVFGVVDGHGDIVMPGAFKAGLAERKSAGRPLPPMFFQHAMADLRPVGVWEAIEEDAKGLKVKGRLSGLDTDTGRFNLALVRDGAMRGLSIGYRVRPGGAKAGDRTSGAARILSDVDLIELSIVSEGSNAQATITDVKAIQSPKDFERLLREAGFPREAAKKLTAGGWPALAKHSQPSAAGALLKRIEAARAELKGYTR